MTSSPNPPDDHICDTALRPSPTNDHLCGGRVIVSYVWENRFLKHSQIQHTNGNSLQGFPKKCHFAVKVSRAIIRTSHRVEALKKPNSCTLIVTKDPDAPCPTDMEIAAIDIACEKPPEVKNKEMADKTTYPVIVEKVDTKNIFGQPFPLKSPKSYPYSPHCPARLTQHQVTEAMDQEKKCKTVNVVTFKPPFVLLYGAKCSYRLLMSTDRPSLLDQTPTMVINFYGHMYETTNDVITGYKDCYFSGIEPLIANEEQEEPEPEKDFWQYESDIDDFDDKPSEEEQKAAEFKEQAAAVVADAEKRLKKELAHRQLKMPSWANIATVKPEETNYPVPPGWARDDYPDY